MRNRKVDATVNLYETLDEIRQWVGDRKAKSYTRQGCKVSLAKLKSKPANRVVLDVDVAFSTDKAKTSQCDFILFHIDDEQNCLIGVPMELKSGSVNASEAVAQLQEGARIADNCTPKGTEINLIPVLIYGRRMHTTQRNKLRTARIKFRGEEFPINTTRCGKKENLALALAKSTKR